MAKSAPATDAPLILYEEKGSVAYITFNRPHVRNAMNTQSYIDTLEALHRFLHDDSLHAVIFTGSGDKAFNAGGDLGEYVKTPPETWTQRDFPPFPLLELNDLLWNCPKVVISAVNGHCAGWGMVVLGASDLRVSIPDALFGYVGAVTVFGGSGAQVPERLVMQVPYAKAMEMLLTDRMMTAQEAMDYDLLTRIVSREELMAAAEDLAAQTARVSPRAVRVIKQAVRRVQSPAIAYAHETTMREARAHLRSEDFRESLRAWSEQRPAKWTGQ